MAEFFSANNSQNNPQYNSLLEKFLQDMNEMNGMNGEDVSRQVGEALSELCRFLRVEKLTGVFCGESCGTASLSLQEKERPAI